jgi:hypothetical protein
MRLLCTVVGPDGLELAAALPLEYVDDVDACLHQVGLPCQGSHDTQLAEVVVVGCQEPFAIEVGYGQGAHNVHVQELKGD